MTESIQAWFVTAQRHLLWKNCGTVCCCLSCSFSSFLLLSAFVFTLLFNIKTASALPNGREKEEEVQNHICQKNRHWYQRRTNVSSSAWGKEKEGMEELQYIENGMRAHTDNAITKVWCDLRVKAEDWEFGLLGDIWVSSINLSLTLGNFLCSSICLPIYIYIFKVVVSCGCGGNWLLVCKILWNSQVGKKSLLLEAVSNIFILLCYREMAKNR